MKATPGSGCPRLTSPRIQSSLPLENPAFQTFLRDFAGHLDEVLDRLIEASEQAQFTQAAEVAHQLVGTGRSAGFPVITEMSRELERAARCEDTAQFTQLLDDLQAIAQRLDIPS